MTGRPPPPAGALEWQDRRHQSPGLDWPLHPGQPAHLKSQIDPRLAALPAAPEVSSTA